MKIFNQLGKAVQGSAKLLQNYVKDYIVISPQSKQLILKPKAVLLLCQQAIARVEKLETLEPHEVEGLLAVIEHQQIKAKVHFTPEKILVKGDMLEGQLRLLNKIQCEASSPIYRALILGWQTFLGGAIPTQAVPEGVTVDGDRVYYKLPKSQLHLIDALFHNLEEGSALNLSLKQGELQIDSAVAVNWSDINLQDLLQIFNTSFAARQG